MSRLFRQEVLDARRNQWLGPVSIAQGPRIWVLGALACSAALLVGALLSFGEYTRRTRVVGQITPSSGLVTIQSPTSGIIADVRVAEGERVEEGAGLARIDVPSATGDESSTSRAVVAAIADRTTAMTDSYAAQRSQLVTREASLAQQRDGLDSELSALAAELEQRQAQLAIAEQGEARFASLREQQFVTDAQWQQQKSQVLEQRVAIQRIRRDMAQLRRQLAVIAQEQLSLPDQIDALVAAEARDRASLGQERLETARRNEAMIAAPVAGTVTAQLGLPGQSIQAGQPVLTLLPDGARLEAHLFVPSRAVGFVEPGDDVLLRFHAFPYQKFGQGRGEVVRVSRSALSSGELSSIAVQGSAPEPLYRVIVQLERETVEAFGKQEPLKPGMMLEADVLGEERKLWEWLLEPLYSVRGRTLD
ncbi:HlyD family efflux transporter periplasmic adaptor subunit [Silanimonas sp.]|uniref:HlyD family efflux transporter periplasmic adaptor subunit n=1 Tax=Silanimonas sp. TaxID=1929290 RepID=UPI0022BD71F9|nr:HlyD family efflux transporter periplasmic adaptor subunit [Silanimonas sp.]MCZ8114991.1 HlyD family efflux transporter periplasmic adaptor subunit [Silanimonas sp.]